MSSSHFNISYAQVVEGVKFQILHQDESMIMAEFQLQKGAVLPEHVHQCSHSSYLLKGKVRLNTENIIREFIEGDSWSMNQKICHSTEALEDSVILEVYDNKHEDHGFKVSTPANMIEL